MEVSKDARIRKESVSQSENEMKPSVCQHFRHVIMFVVFPEENNSLIPLLLPVRFRFFGRHISSGDNLPLEQSESDDDVPRTDKCMTVIRFYIAYETPYI